MAQFKYFDTTDLLKSEKIKTYGAWSDSPLDINTAGEAILTTFFTASAETGSWDGNYFYNVYEIDPNTVNLNAPSQFSIAFGTKDRYELGGAEVAVDAALKYTYPSYAVYKQFVNFLTNDGSDGHLQYMSSSGAVVTMSAAYIISVARDRFRDGLDPMTWRIKMDGTYFSSSAATSNGQEYYEIVKENTTTDSYGRFYPSKGIYVFDAIKLATVIPVLSSISNGYEPNTVLTPFFKTLSSGSNFQLRAQEKAQSSFYFVRVKNFEYNRTENPTWTSGSNNDIRTEFSSEPRTYITTIGLYDDTTIEPLAIAKLSSPLLKTQETEALVRVMLSW